MTARTLGLAASAAAAVLMLTAVPASAMHWIIYAPDEQNYRYWMDKDSIVTKDGYTFVTFVLGAPNSAAPTAPTTPDSQRIGINCKTGASVYNRNGRSTAGPHFGPGAYLYRAVCEHNR